MRYTTLGTAALVLGLAAGCASRTAPTEPPSGTGSSAAAQTQLTPQNLEELMHKIGPAYESMLKDLQANNTADAAKRAQELAEWFGGVEKFWAQQNRETAVKWADQARTYASDAAGAAATGDGAKATRAATNMGTACKQCHSTHREPDGAGGYRVKGLGRTY